MALIRHRAASDTQRIPVPEEAPLPGNVAYAEEREKSRRERIGLAFFWLVILAYGFFVPSILSWNTESHLYPAFAIVDHGTVRIDAYHQGLGDQSYWHGHYYTDKAPGLSYLAVPVYGTIRLAFPNVKISGFQLYKHIKNYYYIPEPVSYVRYAITYVLVALPSAVLAVLLWLFLARISRRTGWALALAAIYALGTIAYVYSIWFFSHQICAVLLFGAFLLIFYQFHEQRTGSTSEESEAVAREAHGSAQETPITRGGMVGAVQRVWMDHGRRALLAAAGAGLLAGYSVISEYPTAVIAAGLGIYLVLLARDRVRALAAYVVGALPPAALLIAYNLIAYGQPFATGYMYVHSKAYNVHVQGGPGGLANPLSFGVQAPTLDSIWQITFGLYRGIFPISPVLLLFIPGAYLMWRRREFRLEWWLCVAVVAVYFLIDAARGPDTNGWSGGSSVASRHLTPMLPFMIVPIIFGIGNRAFRIALAVLGAISVALMFMIVSATYLFPYTDRNPLFNEVFPSFFHGQIEANWVYIWRGTLGLTGASALLPFFGLVLCLVGRIIWLFRFAPQREARAAQITGQSA